MGKRQPVICRECKKKIDRDELIEGIDWIMPSKNWFYHKSCYETWVKNRADSIKNVEAVREDNEYRIEIYDYLQRHLKVKFDGGKVGTQLNLMLKKKRTLKGIYFSLIYWFDILGNLWDDKYDGIWIAELKYDEAREYWSNRAINDHELLHKVETQIKSLYNAPEIDIRKKVTKKSFTSNFKKIEEMDEEDE